MNRSQSSLINPISRYRPKEDSTDLIQSVPFTIQQRCRCISASEDTIKILQATYFSSVRSVKPVGTMLVIFLCIIMDTVNSSKVNRNIRKMETLGVFELLV